MCMGGSTPSAPDPIPPPPPLPAATPPPPPPKPPAPPPMQETNIQPAEVAVSAATKRKKSTQNVNSASNRQMLSASAGVNTGSTSPSNGVNI